MTKPARLEEYRRGTTPLPRTMRSWRLYGAGLGRLGHDGEPEDVPVPGVGPDQLLVRQDACGLCFSDTKVIALGPDHPRMLGRDMSANPVTLGHEVACTVVGVGARLHDRFHVGQRYVIQADVYYSGVSMAYGYVISGGLAEYSVIPREVIEGDEGCYLIPVDPATGYAEAALTEPWACVVAAYDQRWRAGLRAGGRLLVAGGGAATVRYEWSSLLRSGPPRSLTMSLKGPARQDLLAAADSLGTVEVTDVAVGWLGTPAAERPEEFDDVVILDEVSPDEIEQAAALLSNHGIMNFVLQSPVSRSVYLDIGRIHYDQIRYLGTSSTSPVRAYRDHRTADLVAGGLAWFIGAGGPMGQMHVQRALQHPQPPARIVATDIDVQRLASLTDRFLGAARDRGIDLVPLAPDGAEQMLCDDELRHLTGGHGFDDIVCLVPSPDVIRHASQFLARGGWLNIFAGVARGARGALDINAVAQRGVRYLGSSGSSLANMTDTLARVERHELSTNASLAAIGGMDAAAEGLLAVAEGRFPGKTLIFPTIRNLPLTPLEGLRARFPGVHAKLADARFWTKEAEDELFASALEAQGVDGCRKR